MHSQCKQYIAVCNFQLALRDIAIEQLVSLFAICLIGVVVAHRYIYGSWSDFGSREGDELGFVCFYVVCVCFFVFVF